MSEQIILTDITDNIGTIIMNKPEVHNAFNEDMISELTKAFTTMDNDDNVRVIVLKGNGKSFSAGGDLNWMRRTAEYDFDENFNDAMNLGTLLKTINTCSKPTIAVVHGNAFGGGVGLTACCDIAIADKNTNFCLSEVRIGLIPSIIAPYVLTAIGERQARRYFLTAERFKACIAKEIGLIHESTEDINVTLNTIINNLMNGAPNAQKMGKELIRKISQQEINDDIIKYTAKKIAEARAADEGKEGLSAFLNKTKPSWQK